jgi:hypothetical protein
MDFSINKNNILENMKSGMGVAIPTDKGGYDDG